MDDDSDIIKLAQKAGCVMYRCSLSIENRADMTVRITHKTPTRDDWQDFAYDGPYWFFGITLPNDVREYVDGVIVPWIRGLHAPE